MKNSALIITALFGVLGWLLFFGSTFAIQHIEITPKSGAKYCITKVVPFWHNSMLYQMSEDGDYVMNISYVYGIYSDQTFVAGSQQSFY